MDAPDYVELAPPPALADLVHRFWFLRGGPPGPEQTVVPDGRPEILLHLGEPFGQIDGSGRARTQARALVSGQLTGPLRLAPRAGADIVGIRFQPAAAGLLLALPLRLLRDAVVPLADIRPRLVAMLLDATMRSGRPDERAAALAAVLGASASSRRSGIGPAAVRALEAPGPVRVRPLARTLGVTPRTLERRFQEEVGVTPAAYRGIVRFRRAYRLLEQTPQGGWARVAALAGYYDQSHLVREFRRFAGRPPSAWFAPDAALASAILAGDTVPAG